MYLPKHFEAKDPRHLIDLMHENNFATLVSTREGVPFATHLPVLVREGADGQALVIDAHVARANPHWRALEADARVLLIFQGPHAYISPANYVSRQRVPTWNYVAVHASGSAEIVDTSEGKLAILARLIDAQEPAFAAQFAAFEPAARDGLVAAIVGLKIAVHDLQGKFKLNQHRLDDDLPELQERFERGDENHRMLATWMKRLGFWPAEARH